MYSYSTYALMYFVNVSGNMDTFYHSVTKRECKYRRWWGVSTYWFLSPKCQRGSLLVFFVGSIQFQNVKAIVHGLKHWYIIHRIHSTPFTIRTNMSWTFQQSFSSIGPQKPVDRSYWSRTYGISRLLMIADFHPLQALSWQAFPMSVKQLQKLNFYFARPCSNSPLTCPDTQYLKQF